MDIKDTRAVLTREGFAAAQKELEELIDVRRPAVTHRLREALQLGDLNENFDYHDAKKEQGLIEARIRDLRTLLDTATVIDCPNDDGHIGVGSKVTIRDTVDGYEEKYVIVGPAESDPSNGKISLESCIGSALMGCRAGDKITVETPGGTCEYEVLSVG